MSPMSDIRWQRVNDLFHAALERESAARDTFLREACGADEALYAEVVSLIAADSATPAVSFERLGEHAAADWASGPERVSLVGQRIDRYQSSHTSAPAAWATSTARPIPCWAATSHEMGH
jgi:hypothetical protein